MATAALIANSGPARRAATASGIEAGRSHSARTGRKMTDSLEASARANDTDAAMRHRMPGFQRQISAVRVSAKAASSLIPTALDSRVSDKGNTANRTAPNHATMRLVPARRARAYTRAVLTMWTSSDTAWNGNGSNPTSPTIARKYTTCDRKRKGPSGVGRSPTACSR